MHQTGKKLCAILLVVCMLVGVLPMSALAAESAAAQFVGQQLNLGDDLTMQYYVSVDSAYVDSAAMTVAVDGSTVGTHTLSEMTAEEDGTYKISVDMAAAQMTDEISLTLTSADETIAQKTYTVVDYAKALLEGSYSDETKALVKQMLNYGAKAQVYFAHNTGKLANDGYVLETAATMPEEETEMTISGSVAGISFYGASMVFVSKLAVRYYFSAPSGLGESTFVVDGVSYTPESKGDLYYIEVPGIDPHKMDTAMEVVVSDGETELTIGYSPMCYITRMYNKETTGTALKELLQATYGYYQAAETYVGLTSYTVTFSDGAAAQTVENGCLAEKPTVSKDGYYFLGWYNGDTKFDFTQPITSDVSLTAKWEEVPDNMWFSFNDEAASTSVWFNSDRASLTWHESYDGEDGVLQIDKTAAQTESYVGNTNGTNWVAEFDQEHYKNAVALCFRVKLVADKSTNVIPNGRNGSPEMDSMLTHGLTINGGWQDIVIPVGVYENYDALNGLYFYTSSSGAYSLYIDEITVVEEDPFMWYSFGDDSCTNVWKSDRVTLTWLESHDGADGVLQVDKPASDQERYLCKIEGGANFTPIFPQSHYEGAVGLRFRIKLVTEQSVNVAAYGKNWNPKAKTVINQAADTGWVEVVIPYDVYTDYEALSGMFFYMSSSGAFTLYFDEITAVYDHTVSFSDGVESQTVQTGSLATKPTPTKEGYYFKGWYDGDTKFDFSTPITSDVSLTAKWEEVPDNMWFSFSDEAASTSVWVNSDRASLTWHESYDGEDGVLQIDKTTAKTESYVGNTNGTNWVAEFDQEHYKNAVALSFRVKLVSEQQASVSVIGKNWGLAGQPVVNSKGDSGWVDVVIPYDVYTNYDLLNGLFFYTSSSGAYSLYIDEITVVEEPGNMWYGFSDDSCTNVWKSSGLTLTQLESYDGEEGVLQVDYAAGYENQYLCKIEGGQNWTPVFPQYHYEGAAGLRFRVKLVAEQSANIVAYGTNLKLSSLLDHGLVRNSGWQDIVIPVDVYTNYDALSGLYFWTNSSGAFTLYFDEITVVYNHTVSFSDGVESQTVLGGTLATEPTVTKDGCYFMGWYNGDTLFDFTQPITSDVSLTAKWGEGVDNTWYSFNNRTDATSVYIPSGVSYDWHASFDGHDGVLQINKTSAEVERYIGKDNGYNWVAQYEQAHYEGATALCFRIRLVSEKQASIAALGKGWKISAKTLVNNNGDTGWIDVVVPYDVYTNYDLLNGLFFYTSSSGNWTLYIDQITAVYETEA